MTQVYGLGGIESRLDKIENNLKQLNDSLSRIANSMELLTYPHKQLQNYIMGILDDKEKLEKQYLALREQNRKKK